MPAQLREARAAARRRQRSVGTQDLITALRARRRRTRAPRPQPPPCPAPPLHLVRTFA